MTDRTDRRDLPLGIPEAHRIVWCEWFRRHGINPDTVLCGGWVERQPSAYRIAYLGLDLDETGQPFARTDPITGEEENSFATCVHVAQLEGPPLPFPDESLTPHDDGCG